jgi:hypothetical protein
VGGKFCGEPAAGNLSIETDFDAEPSLIIRPHESHEGGPMPRHASCNARDSEGPALRTKPDLLKQRSSNERTNSEG